MTPSRLIDVLDPRTGLVDLRLMVPQPEEVRALAGRLRAAQPAWQALGLEGRIAVMQRWAKAIESHASSIIAADSRDTGFGQISRISAAMMLGFLRGTCAQAPGQWAAALRSGT